MRDLQTEWTPNTFRWASVIDETSFYPQGAECLCTASPEPGLCQCEYELKYGRLARRKWVRALL